MESNIIRVKLFKRAETGLGFSIQQRALKPFCQVAALASGGIAELSGLIHLDDIILRINDIDVSEMKFDNVVEILKSVPVESPVVMLLRGPDGYYTYLRTVFTDNGAPRTVRITSPSNNSTGSPGAGKVARKFGQTPSPICTPKSSPKIKAKNGGTIPQSPLVTDTGRRVNGETKTPVVNGDLPSKPPTPCSPMGSPKIVVTSAPPMPPSSSDSEDDESTDSENTPQGVQVNTRGNDQGIEIKQKDDVIRIIFKDNVKKEDKSETKVDTASAPEKDDGYGSTRRNSKTIPSHLNLDEAKSLDNDEDHSKNRSRRKSLQSPTTPSRRRTSSTSPKKYVRLKNIIEDRYAADTHHLKSLDTQPCTQQRCMAAVMSPPFKRPAGVPRPKDELIQHAKDFIDQYYTSIKRYNTPAHQTRWKEVLEEIEIRETYDLTCNELTFGAKTGWRNSPRCVGRIQWSKLQVFDARHIHTARGMFEAICNHIKYGTNKGNIRSAITIFAHRTDGKHDYRVWNAQIIRYAGYRQADGSVVGDPANVEFTELCQKLGWRGKGGRFDVMPLLLQANGQDPELFEVPPELVLEVPLRHPQYPGFEELGLKWYGLPAVSLMVFDCGGLEFTACPFNGWYMGTEVGARNLCDSNRYNVLEPVAKVMGLDTRKCSSLWKDRVAVEVNVAVLYSYQTAGVTIIDHHSATESFMKHLDNENRTRGGCPCDWGWLVPPISGSITPVFHQEMINYVLKPNYEYQEDASKYHIWMKDRQNSRTPDRPRRKFGFRELARAVKFSAKLMGKALARRVKCTILYASETGKSERYAKTLCEIFKHAFDARVMCMDEYDVTDLEHETLVLAVMSTFGNGDPPDNGMVFSEALFQMRKPIGSPGSQMKSFSYIRMSRTTKEAEMAAAGTESPDEPPDDNLTFEGGQLSNVRFSVFGLGSTAYPHFCAFANYMDRILTELGGERFFELGEGDELCGQEESFKSWANGVFAAACDTFCITDSVNMQEAVGALNKTDFSWSAEKFRLTPLDNQKEADISTGLSKLHNKNVLPCKMIEKRELQDKESSRQTILLRMDTQGAFELNYEPGIHVAIFPANQSEIVDVITSRLYNVPPPGQLFNVEVLHERVSALGTKKAWEQFSRFPPCTLRTALLYYLDVTTPPSSHLLKLLAAQSTKDSERDELLHLANDLPAYEEWKYEHSHHIAEVLTKYTSIKAPPSLLLTQLPLLQQRYYSISSSPKAYPSEIHITVAVVKYKTQGGEGPLHYGVCSSWLNRCRPGDIIPCFVRTGLGFRMPEDATLPMLLIGPGTGIAPYRSFWQQRRIDMTMNAVPSRGNRTGWGKLILYFGCRNSNIDHLYKDEVEQAKQEGALAETYTALSREAHVPKTYVQDLLLKNSLDVFDLLQNGGHVYVCGDVAMAHDVSETLEKVVQERGEMTSQNAKKYLIRLRDSLRYHEDIFGITLRRSEDLIRDKARNTFRQLSLTQGGSLDKSLPPAASLDMSSLSHGASLEKILRQSGSIEKSPLTQGGSLDRSLLEHESLA